LGQVEDVIIAKKRNLPLFGGILLFNLEPFPEDDRAGFFAFPDVPPSMLA
jgi:hypothetical protein